MDHAPGGAELFDLLRWKEPPHVALANLRPDAKALSAFTRRYGVVSDRQSSGLRFVTPSDVGRFRDYLQLAWRGDEKVIEQMLVDVRASLQVRSTGVEVAVEDLWTLARLTFLQDKLAGRTQVCAAANTLYCPAPYFLAARKGQTFCSHRCAVLINVRRFRERESQRLAPTKDKDTAPKKHATRTKAR